MFDFKDKVVVVTGAAGNLGSAVVQKFLQNGATVCPLDHGKGRIETLFDPSDYEGRLYIYEEMDVTDRSQMIDLGKRIQEDVGAVDVVINTVGGFTAGERVHEISPETWQRMMNLNVKSFLNTAAAFTPGMLEKGQGKVVSIGSRASLNGSAKTGAYAGAKSALLRLTESMSEELKDHNIQVNCVLPGTIDTPENRQAMPKADYDKWVTPEQVSNVILFLSSPDANAVTGAALTVFGK